MPALGSVSSLTYQSTASTEVEASLICYKLGPALEIFGHDDGTVPDCLQTVRDNRRLEITPSVAVSELGSDKDSKGCSFFLGALTSQLAFQASLLSKYRAMSGGARAPVEANPSTLKGAWAILSLTCCWSPSDRA